ncbi:MAG: UbiA family prenyltransferase [Saprospiraceae bacterium]|nr:UbiA family prenyltransferase [Saprospiraceae bacterium]
MKENLMLGFSKRRNLQRKLNAYLNLSRLGMMPLTISVSIITLCLLPESHGLEIWLGAIALGMWVHAFGFALNDCVDYPIDKTVPYRQKSPLVSGALNMQEAIGFTILQALLAYVTYIGLLGGRGMGIALLSLSMLSSIVYNIWSKRGVMLRFIAEFCLALSLGLLVLAIAFALSISLSPLVYAFAGTLSLVLLQLNSVPSGLKDLKTDYEFGAKSFVIATGAKMLDDRAYHLPKRLKIYALSLQVLIIGGLILCIYLMNLEWYYASMILLLSIYASVHIYHLLQIKFFQKLLLFSPLLSGYFNYIAVSLIVIKSMPYVFYLVPLYFLTYPLRQSISLPKKQVKW